VSAAIALNDNAAARAPAAIRNCFFKMFSRFRKVL
jgi:hypothetical protein